MRNRNSYGPSRDDCGTPWHTTNSKLLTFSKQVQVRVITKVEYSDCEMRFYNGVRNIVTVAVINVMRMR